MLYLCIVIQKEKSHTDLTDPTDLLSLQATVLTKTHSQNSEGAEIREIRVQKLNINPLKFYESNEESKKNRFDRGTLQCHTY